MPRPGRICTFKPCIHHKENKGVCTGKVCNGWDFFQTFCARCDTRELCILRNRLGKDDACVIRLYYALYQENLKLKKEIGKLKYAAKKQRVAGGR